MTVSPINITRVTQNLRTGMSVNTMQSNQLELFRLQSHIATGRRFGLPSDDPVAATRALGLNRALVQQDQYIRNVQFGSAVLDNADAAMNEINALLIDAQSIANQNVDDVASPEERASAATLIAGIRDQLVTIGNRQVNGRYIFGGQQTDVAPFREELGGVAYLGDNAAILVQSAPNQSTAINVSGEQLFGAISTRLQTAAALTPVLTADTRLDEVNGVGGEIVRAGQLIINESGGAGRFTVDLSTADTVGDIADSINAAAESAGASITASVTEIGIEITTGGAPITITDTSSGSIASQLGIDIDEPTSGTVVGFPLQRRLTRLTPIEDIQNGSIDLNSGLAITNGQTTVNISFNGAATVQDILNRINNAGVFVRADINPEGTGIDIFNQVSGTALSVSENGGTTATDLGLRTLGLGTPLSELNAGIGVRRIEGQVDVQITAGDGSAVTVNLDSAETLGDVIDLINAAAQDAGVNVSASLASVGNGIQITDATGGSGQLSASGINLSQAAIDLGIATVAADGETQIQGADVNPVRSNGVISVLRDLEAALLADDTQAIDLAAQRLEQATDDVTAVHGIVGARNQSLQNTLQQTQSAADSTQILLSETQDIDYAEAITRLVAAESQYQATLSVTARAENLSLFNFLR